MTTVKTFNIHYTKTNLSQLIEMVLEGEPFIIAKAGKPLVKVVALDAPDGKVEQRIGALKGKFKSPTLEEFNAIGKDEIAQMFGLDDEVSP